MRGELHARMMHSSSRGWKENERARERDKEREMAREERRKRVGRTQSMHLLTD